MIHRIYGKSGLQNHIVAPWYQISASETNVLAEHIGLWVILAPKACANAYSPHSTPSSQSGSAAAKCAGPSNTRLQFMCYLTMAWCLLPFPFISHTHTTQNNCPRMASCQRTLMAAQIHNKNKHYTFKWPLAPCISRLLFSPWGSKITTSDKSAL